MKFETPQADIDRCLAVERSVQPDEMALYLEYLSDVPLSVRVANPRPCDCEGRDVRDGCILIGLFIMHRKKKEPVK
jgi:hypothetical protein